MSMINIIIIKGRTKDNGLQLVAPWMRIIGERETEQALWVLLNTPVKDEQWQRLRSTTE